jgi:hypothetical protein
MMSIYWQLTINSNKMLKLKNYWRATSPTIKKMSLWLKSTIGALALSAYATSEVKVGFYLLIAGAIIDGVLQLLPPDQDAASADKSTVKGAAVVALVIMASIFTLSSCRVIKPEVNRTKTDSTITTYKQVEIKVPGAKVFAGLNLDSLYHAALMAKDQRSEDSILWLNMELKYKQDSIAALKANKPIPAKPVNIPSPPQIQYVTDPQSKAQLAYWIDAYGKFQISCESRDRIIHALQAEITKLTQDKWNEIAMAVLATLLVISLIINFINRKS